jgi:hypothetical protein
MERSVGACGCTLHDRLVRNMQRQLRLLEHKQHRLHKEQGSEIEVRLAQPGEIDMVGELAFR